MEAEDCPLPLSYLHDRDIEQIVSYLEPNDRGALRATCKANKAAVEAHVHCAAFYGVARTERQLAGLPTSIKEVKIHALGPPTKEWLCHSLADLPALTKLNLSSVRGNDEDMLKRKRCPPNSVGPLEMLHHLSTTRLKELRIEGFGQNVRYTREKQWRALLPPKEKVESLAHTLEVLTISDEFRLYKNLFQGLILPMTKLRSLDLNGTHFGYLNPYATHELSQMTCLTSLTLHGCCAVLASHIAPLYTITSLKSLDLSDVQFNESHEDFVDLDPLFHKERLGMLDHASQQFVLQLRRLTGLGPQVPLGLGESSAPLTPAPGNTCAPSKFILKQLGRCTGLERFACIGWDLPDSEPDEWQVWDDLDMGAHMLVHLTNLTSLGLNDIMPEYVPHIACLPHLTSLNCDIPMTDNAEGDSAPLAAILDAMSETALLPKLTELVLDNVFVNQPANMDALSQLTAVTNLELGHINIPWMKDQTSVRGLSAIIAAVTGRGEDAPKLQRLVISEWDLPQASILSSLTSLRILDVSHTSVKSRPFMAWLDWPPELFSRLCNLTQLTCRNTNFADDHFIRALTCSPSLQVIRAKGCLVSELGLLCVSHPGAARAALNQFTRRLKILKEHDPLQFTAYLRQSLRQGLPDGLLSAVASPLAFELSSLYAAGEEEALPPVRVRAPLKELDLSSQVEVPRASLDASSSSHAWRSIGDAAALALAVSLPGLCALCLQECPRLGGPGWLALSSLRDLVYLDVRRCAGAGDRLFALAAGQASSFACADALKVVEELRADFCARLAEQEQGKDAWMPESAGDRHTGPSVISVAPSESLTSPPAGIVSSSEAAADATIMHMAAADTTMDTASSEQQAAEPPSSSPATAAGGSEQQPSSSSMEALSSAWLSSLEECVRGAESRKMFPSLLKLMVTDDRADPNAVVPAAEVDSLADRVASGVLSLRELHVDMGAEEDEPDSDSSSSSSDYGGGGIDTDYDSSTGSGSVSGGGDSSESSQWTSDDEEGGGEGQQQQPTGGGPQAMSSSSSSDDDSSDDDGSGEWEEHVFGEDAELDDLARLKMEVRTLPKLLQHANCKRWLDAGLLVVKRQLTSDSDCWSTGS